MKIKKKQQSKERQSTNNKRMMKMGREETTKETKPEGMQEAGTEKNEEINNKGR